MALVGLRRGRSSGGADGSGPLNGGREVGEIELSRGGAEGREGGWRWRTGIRGSYWRIGAWSLEMETCSFSGGKKGSRMLSFTDAFRKRYEKKRVRQWPGKKECPL